MSILVYYCLLTMLCLLSNVLSLKKASSKRPVYRLPQTLWPEEYKLKIIIADDTFQTEKFRADLELTFRPSADVTEIKLHANRLQFADIKLFQNATQIPLKNTKFEPDPVTEIFTLKPDGSLLNQTLYKLHFQYTGELRTKDMYGFYRSQYMEKGQLKYLAITQFKPTMARRAFPCFDEPMFKAIFRISITHPDYLTPLANSPVFAEDTEDDVTTTFFSKTPKMSTYLVAFMVSEFTCEKSVTAIHYVPHQVCSRKETGNNRRLALEIAPKILRALGNLTNLMIHKGGIKKIDEVALPDFATGAMENWGLSTFRESYLLWDENETSNKGKQIISTVIAHGLAHMWFGDLVTMRWWSDTFLSEGFARYFEYFTTAEVEPTWELDKQFVLDVVHVVFEQDCESTSTPLSFEVNTPSEIFGRLGILTYNKGASIIRMVEHFMGKNRFRMGLHLYLTKYAHGNTVPSDLWKSLKAQGFDFPVPGDLDVIMDNWINKPGYPVLLVENSGADIIISQERFFNDETTPKSSDKWYVPISYTVSRDANKFQDTLPKNWLLPNKNLTISNVLSPDDDEEWVILNNQQIGYYRVSYSDVLLGRIRQALDKPNFDGIIDTNRAYLINDLYSFANAGSKTFLEFLNFVGYIQGDKSFVPWRSTIDAFSRMLVRIGDPNLREQFKKYLLGVIDHLYSQEPFELNTPDEHIATLKQVLGSYWACSVGNAECITTSLELFYKYKRSGQKPQKNLRETVYCIGLRHSFDIEADWNFLWAEYLKERLDTEQDIIIKALGCVKLPSILKSFLHIAINGSKGIREQDSLAAFSAVYHGNPEGVDIAAQFLYDNHERISEIYAYTNKLVLLLYGLTDLFTTQRQVDKMKQFVSETRIDEALKSTITSAIAYTSDNLETTKRLENDLRQFFKNGKMREDSIPSTSSSWNRYVIASASSLNLHVMLAFAAVLFALLQACECNLIRY